MALGSRLRRLSDTITDDAQKIYNTYGNSLKANWFPVFYYLSNQEGAKPVTIIATEINHSHPSVIKIVREMSKALLVEEEKDPTDGRKNLISLTKKGKELAIKVQGQYQDVESAINNTLKQTQHNLWMAIQEFEYLLNEKNLFTRVMEEKKKRESSEIKILGYTDEHRLAFKQLNEEWINKYFQMEETDRKVLENPTDQIIGKGGHILVASYKDVVVGVCALLKMDDDKYEFELAKMAVSPAAHGKGIGYLLGKSIIEKAQKLGAKNLYLESNTQLKPAISLYEKLGFKKIVGNRSSYVRCNIQMELVIL